MTALRLSLREHLSRRRVSAKITGRRLTTMAATGVVLLSVGACDPIDPGALPTATCLPVQVNADQPIGLPPADGSSQQPVQVCFTLMPDGNHAAHPATSTTQSNTGSSTPPPPAGSTGSDGHPGHTQGPAESGADGYIYANPPVTGVVPSRATPPRAAHREFQANCTVTHHRADDPIVYPGLPGASHMHTFMGNPTTNALTTAQSLTAATGTMCKVPADKSAYWMPTMYNGDTMVVPEGPQVIYYKSGVNDYPSVRPFPIGLRYVVGTPTATAEQFLEAAEAGWECGDSYHNRDIPANCPAGTQLNIRYQAPSCWNGKHLDSPDHKSHMAYPVDGICPASHPVAVPMIEFKMAFPVSGDMSKVRLASGRGYSFHYDFINAWDPATLAALVKHCINGGLQCNARGFDEFHPQLGAALNEQYRLP